MSRLLNGTLEPAKQAKGRERNAVSVRLRHSEGPGARASRPLPVNDPERAGPPVPILKPFGSPKRTGCSRSGARVSFQSLSWSLWRVAAGFLLAFFLAGCGRSRQPSVVVYCAQDQEYAEPILQDFTRQTGIKFRPLFDSEAVKTVGLANRLLAEKSHPQCDVFWGNEELRARQLAAHGVFQPTNGLACFGFRSRRVVINTKELSLAQAPRSLADLTNAAWRGKVALAYPMFGTTATHFLALRQQWGDAPWRAWCRALQANKPFLVDGNSVVVKFVGRGEAWIGLTDSDDIAAGAREGLPVAALPLNAETLLIPNTVALVRDSPHPTEGGQLFQFLQRPEVAARLVKEAALEGGKPEPQAGLQVNWEALLKDLDPAVAAMKEIFLR
jgi:iron(III) transport system substrate-binding protein